MEGNSVLALAWRKKIGKGMANSGCTAVAVLVALKFMARVELCNQALYYDPAGQVSSWGSGLV